MKFVKLKFDLFLGVSGDLLCIIRASNEAFSCDMGTIRCYTTGVGDSGKHDEIPKNRTMPREVQENI